MSEAQQHGGGAESDFDLTQFYQVFFRGSCREFGPDGADAAQPSSRDGR